MNPSLGKEPEEVVLKATNKAIQNVLGLALYFQGQEDCKVRLRTSSVGVVDDIVESANAPDDGRPDNDNPVKENDEVPESRIRKMSVVEVAITLK